WTVVAPEVIQHLSATHTSAPRPANIRQRGGEGVVGSNREAGMVAPLELDLECIVVTDAVGGQQLNRIHKRKLGVVWLAWTGKRYDRCHAAAARPKRWQIRVRVSDHPAEMTHWFADIANADDVVGECLLERQVEHVRERVVIIKLCSRVYRETTRG